MASCEKDDFLEKELASGSYPVKYSTKTYQELENDIAFTSTFTALHQHFNVGSTSLQGRGSYMEDQYGFSIDSSVVEVAKTDKYTSYTMYISRKEHPKNYFENLVIEVTDTAKTKAYVVQYFPTSSIKPVPEHDSYAFGYDFNFIPIKYNEGSKIDAGGCTPITVTICYESWGDGSDTPHLKTKFCNNPLYLTSYIIGGNCAGNSGDGPSFPNDSPTQGNNSGPSYPYNPGGSGPNNNGNTTITNPLLCYKTQVDCPPELEYWDALKDPCDKIADLLNEDNYPGLKNKLINLKAKTNLTEEKGFYRTSTGTTNPDLPNGGNGFINIPDNVSEPFIILAHTHNSPANSTYSVFSWVDLESINTLLSLEKIDNSKFVLFLFTADGTRLALTIDDTTKFKTFFAIVSDPLFNMENGKKRAKEMYEMYESQTCEPIIREDNNLNTLNDDLVNFLLFMNRNDLGISLFNMNENLTEFNKLNYNQASDNVEEEACD